MAVQVKYPDYYNGAFVACPDPIDFRAYGSVNIYEDRNAYVVDAQVWDGYQTLPGRIGRTVPPRWDHKEP